MNKKRFKADFDFICGQSHLGVEGVWKITSPLPGPTLGVTIHTHGNEPSGLAVLSHFKNVFSLTRHLLKGIVVFVLNNIKATDNFLNSKTFEEEAACRFVDINMNRLPDDVMQLSEHDIRYEVRRAKRLKKVWESFDIGFDIHSFGQNSPPMIMNIGKVSTHLIQGFPIGNIISNIEEIQVNSPAISFYGNGCIPIMAIEAGSHFADTSFKRAILCTKKLLQNLGMLSGRSKSTTTTYTEYVVMDSILFPNKEFELVDTFENYGKVTKGQVIATDGLEQIISPFDGHTIFAPPKGIKKVKNLKEEVMFLTLPKRTFAV